jgi:hypothetical protein
VAVHTKVMAQLVQLQTVLIHMVLVALTVHVQTTQSSTVRMLVVITLAMVQTVVQPDALLVHAAWVLIAHLRFLMIALELGSVITQTVLT